MKNNRNVRKLFYTIFLAFLLCFGIGYASLNASLFIDGIAIIDPSVFDVNLEISDVKASSTYVTKPVIEENTISGNLVFNYTGDFYEFTFDAVNSGNINAMIDNFNVTPTVSGEMANYIKYEVSYENWEAISLKQVVNADSFVRFKVRIEYIGPNSDYDYYVAFSLNINYVESDGTGLNVKDNGVVKYSPVLVSGSLDTVGSEVCIKDECFYIISNNGTTVSMLSKYNLYVGGVYDGSSWEAYGDEATGKQHPEMLGYISGSTLRKGTTKFSDTNYWSGTVSEYPSYVFNDKSIMYNYLNNYKKIFK